ncbi:type III-B CRISPR module RAMP protein Cmr4 [Thermoanaerobacterium thermosaccharolyticum]|jgi:CRISPR-associated RAMP protein, Cmr4 family|uniref:type III-B CRISPR module RAMP protein Cmr4 n=1 Tax=Thermoanaerobacterium thermosaccharolyticum TaxID=1517 RepID=UPI00279B64AB|nr:type III-B CRISPR module RAMP protein Cmr4 [Thermoanaerobacterium thermosaccharolyticum]
MMSDLKVYSMASDPIYIGTGGYTIGRVDNTIVRDPITRIPKIPGSSFAGTMRFYSALELQSAFKEEYRKDPNRRKEKDINELVDKTEKWITYSGNKWSLMKCAGQDEDPNEYYEDFKKMDTPVSGHCGHCIVCKTFGYSKNNKSQQGIAFFSDLNIIFFPVYTRKGVMWITSKQLLEFAGIILRDIELPQGEQVFVITNEESNKGENTINLGWLNLPYITKNYQIADELPDDIKEYIKNKIVLVPDDLISHIINSNLEVRTSVSIDPLTGASKTGALFTSEAIPRGTIFYGDIRLMERPVSNDMPGLSLVKEMIDDVSKYYESFGIGGMVTRGFGRMKVFIDKSEGGTENEQQS